MTLSNSKEKTNWDSDCYYQSELSNLWSKYGHEPNVPENSFDWQSWRKDEQSLKEEHNEQ
jgi:hypothetical protein